MRSSRFIWIILAITVLLDVYVFQALKTVCQSLSPKSRYIIYGIYWTICLSAVILLLILPYVNYNNWPKSVRTYLFATLIGLFFAKVIASLFFVIGDVR